MRRLSYRHLPACPLAARKDRFPRGCPAPPPFPSRPRPLPQRRPCRFKSRVATDSNKRVAPGCAGAAELGAPPRAGRRPPTPGQHPPLCPPHPDTALGVLFSGSSLPGPRPPGSPPPSPPPVPPSFSGAPQRPDRTAHCHWSRPLQQRLHRDLGHRAGELCGTGGLCGFGGPRSLALRKNCAASASGGADARHRLRGFRGPRPPLGGSHLNLPWE